MWAKCLHWKTAWQMKVLFKSQLFLYSLIYRDIPLFQPCFYPSLFCSLPPSYWVVWGDMGTDGQVSRWPPRTSPGCAQIGWPSQDLTRCSIYPGRYFFLKCNQGTFHKGSISGFNNRQKILIRSKKSFDCIIYTLWQSTPRSGFPGTANPWPLIRATGQNPPYDKLGIAPPPQNS